MKALHLIQSLVLAYRATAFVFNTFDGVGSPACYNVTEVHNATSVEEIQTLVRDAKGRGLQVRAGAKGHHWYDTQCSDDETVIIRTEFVNNIWDFDLDAGSVMIEAGVTFFQLESPVENGTKIRWADCRVGSPSISMSEAQTLVPVSSIGILASGDAWRYMIPPLTIRLALANT